MTIDRDPLGRLWVGTQDGAAYFNGHHWIVVNMPSRNLSNYIYDILHASDGSTWFATDGNGVHRLMKGTWTTYGPANGLSNNFARVLAEGTDGSILAGTRQGLFRFNGVDWDRIDIGAGSGLERIRTVLVEKGSGAETIWVGTYGGLVRLTDGDLRIFDATNGLPHNTVQALFYESTPEGTRLLAGTDKGLVALQNDAIERIEGPEPLSKGIRSIAAARNRDGTYVLWVGTDGNGLLSFENGRWNLINAGRGLPGDSVFAIEDAMIGDGSIWISSLGHGVARIERGNWYRLAEANGLEKRIVFGVREFGDSLWFATFGAGVARFSDGAWSFSKTSAGLPGDFVYSLGVADTGSGEQLFAGTEYGVSSRAAAGWSHLDRPELNTEIWSISGPANNDQGLFRIGTSRGLVEIIGDAVRVSNSKNGLPDDRVRDVLETFETNGERTIWAGTYGGGVARFRDNEWTTIDINSGLPSNRVLTLIEYPIAGRRKLLAGTSGGIAVIDIDEPETPIAAISSENTPGMLNNYILDLIVDKKGRLYALTNKGVSRFTPDPSNSGSFTVYTFTTDDGLPSNEGVSGSAFIDSKNRLYVGTVEGVGILDLEMEPDMGAESRLMIESISVSGQTRNDLARSQLNYSDSNLRFTFALLSDFREHASKYRTQMIGFENEPTEWNSEPLREFSYLPAGSYEFRLWGMDHNGNVVTAAGIPFTVKPAWWQTWWAMLVYLLIVIAVVSLIAFAVYRNRVARILEIERVRSRIATDLHDDIGASLSQIAILSEVMTQKLKKGTSVETKPLASIAETSRDLMNSMSDIVWSINPKRDHLKDLVQRMRRFATDVLSAKNVEFDFSAPESELGGRLDLETRRQIYLIYKEAVNNCVKYSGCANLSVEISRPGELFRLIVSDDGSGFEPDPENAGNGLSNMRQRAESIGGVLDISSNEDGTRVVLEVPLKRRKFGFGR